MNSLYLDTNIFIYLADESSKFHTDCLDFINFCQNKKISISTSTETIQEIIHYSKNTKQFSKGLLVAKSVLKLVDEVYSVNKKTIELYLEQTEIYPSRISRDIIHLSVCLENRLNKIITFDQDFNLFKGIKAYKPKDFLMIPN